MKIGIDIRCLEEGRKTGVEEYTLNLLKNIFEMDKENSYVLFLNAWKRSNINLKWTKRYSNVRIKAFHLPNKLLNFCFWYLNWPKIDRMVGGTDIFFMPNINFGAFSLKTKLVVTLHDLSFEHFPETFSLKRRLWHFFLNPRKLCRCADKIIAVSESTRNDIAKFYRINPQKIQAIHSAVSKNFGLKDRNSQEFLRIKEKYRLPYYFILYLGAIEPRKNIAGIIKAYNQLRSLNNSDFNRYKLVIAGAKGWKEKGTSREIEKSKFKEDIINLGFIEAEDKPYLYNLASLFVYPSLFEGFGFPPLEAMSSGVPVIVSNNSSFPEIVEDAGLLIDPEKPDEIFRAFESALSDKDLRNKLRKRGLEQIKKFSWKKTAGEYLKAFKF